MEIGRGHQIEPIGTEKIKIQKKKNITESESSSITLEKCYEIPIRNTTRK